MTRGKKSFLVVFFLLVCVMAGISIYLYTFDLDHYKPEIVAKLTELFETDVHVGRMKLLVLNGARFSFYDVRIGDESKKDESIVVEKMTVIINLVPLLSGKVVVKELLFSRPDFILSRKKNGAITLLSFTVVSKDKSKKSEFPLPLVKKLKIIDGKITFIDSFLKNRVDKFHLTQVNLTLKKKILRHALGFDLSASLLSDSNNSSTSVLLKGKIDNFFSPSKPDVRLMQPRGSLKVSSFSLSRFQPYYKDFFSYSPGDVSLDLDLSFSGNPYSSFSSSGKVFLFLNQLGGKKVLLDQNTFHRGFIKYAVTKDADSIDFERLDIGLGEIKVKSRIKVKNISFSNKIFHCDLDLLKVNVGDLKKLNRLNVFPKAVSGFIKKNLGSGKITLDSAILVTTTEQLAHFKSFNDLAIPGGNIAVDGLSVENIQAYLPFRDISGNATFKDGQLHLGGVSFFYGNSQIKNITGTVSKTAKTLQFDTAVSGKLVLKQLYKHIKKDIPFGKKKFFQSVRLTEGTALVAMSIKGNSAKPKSLEIAGGVVLQNAGLQVKDEVVFSDVNGKIDIDKSSIRINKLKGKSDKTSLMVEGEITSYKSNKPGISLTVSADFTSSFLKKLKGSSRFGVFSGGHMPVQSFVAGSLDMIEVRSKVDLKPLTYSYPGFIEKPAGVPASINLNGRIIDFEDIFLEKVSLAVDSKDIVEVKGDFMLAKENILFALHFPSFELAGLEKINFFMKGKSSFSGMVEGDLQVEFNKRKKELSLDGMLSFDKFSFIQSGGKPPITGLSAQVQFKGKSVTVKRLKTQVGSSAIFLEGIVNDYTKPVFVLDVKSPDVNFDELIGLIPEKNSDRKIIWKFFADKGSYKKYRFSNLSGNLKVENKKIDIYHLTLNFIGGKIEGKGWIDLKDKTDMKMDLEIDAKSIEFRALLEKFFYKHKDSLGGKLDFSSGLRSHGISAKEVLKNLNGDLSFALKDGFIDKTKFSSRKLNDEEQVKEQKDREGKKKENKIIFDAITGKFEITQGKAVTDSFTLRTHKMNAMTAAGTIDLGFSEIDTKACIKKHVVLDTIVSKIPIFGKLLTGSEKSMALKCFSVRGNLFSPKVSEVSPTSIRRKVLEAFGSILEIPKNILLPTE